MTWLVDMRGERDPRVASGGEPTAPDLAEVDVATGRYRVGVLRAIWIVAGLASVAIGTVGVIVPGLPTTVFFIVAAACFARSSPRLEAWILDLPRIGPMVRDHRAGLGMSRRAKGFACTSIIVFSTLGAIAIDALAVRLVIGAAAVIGVLYVGFRVPTRETVLAERALVDGERTPTP